MLKIPESLKKFRRLGRSLAAVAGDEVMSLAFARATSRNLAAALDHLVESPAINRNHIVSSSSVNGHVMSGVKWNSRHWKRSRSAPLSV
ncbi:uncharacterized protein [Ambystoma mexicanum]|uniref:uncharacterized protein isoform X1 n=1 Tax=Ambystoma mexicanum TaxID=8296 RepID=UPI0037E80174